jgi:hypothetical protein
LLSRQQHAGSEASNKVSIEAEGAAIYFVGEAERIFLTDSSNKDVSKVTGCTGSGSISRKYIAVGISKGADMGRVKVKAFFARSADIIGSKLRAVRIQRS